MRRHGPSILSRPRKAASSFNFPDLPNGWRRGETREEALAQAEGLPDEMILGRVAHSEHIPRPPLATARTLLSTLLGHSASHSERLLAAIRALAACMCKTQAFTDFALLNHLIRARAAVAGYADPEAADFPVKLASGYIGID
jgi:predicted RNase H-like HicB family nuclease